MLCFSMMIKYLEEASRLVSAAFGAEAPLTLDQIFALLERPPTEDKGDIAFPCFQVAKALRKAPPMIASELAKKLETAKGGSFQWIQPLEIGRAHV